MTFDQQQQPPTTPLPASTGQTIGHVAASFAATVIVLLVQFGVPITPDQQASILSVIVTGWAFLSTIYAFWHRDRTNRIADAHTTKITTTNTISDQR